MYLLHITGCINNMLLLYQTERCYVLVISLTEKINLHRFGILRGLYINSDVSIRDIS